MKYLIFLFALFFVLNSNAQRYVGTVAAVKGDVKVLSPAKSRGLASPTVGKRMKYNGQVYKYKKARIGMKVRAKEVLHSGPEGKAKVIYPNGDHYMVSAGSSIELPSLTITKEGPRNQMEVFYGKVRSVVSKKYKAKRRLKVKTKTAVVGVRGTDFVVHADGGGFAEVSVLRGEVEVGVPLKGKTESVNVKSGNALQVRRPKGAKKVNIKEEKISKKKVREISADSKIDADAQRAALPEHFKDELEKLEKKAVQVVLQDVKAENPKLYEKLKDSGLNSTDQLDQEVMDTMKNDAPLDQESKDKIYERFFEVE